MAATLPSSSILTPNTSAYAHQNRERSNEIPPTHAIDTTVEDTNIIKRQFTDFLEDYFENGSYAQKLRALIENGKRRLEISLDDLRIFDPSFTRNLLLSPAVRIPAMEDALNEYALYLRPDLQKSVQEFRIAFYGSFGSRQVSPRGLLAEFLGGLVCIEGIVTRCSLVRPKLVFSTHYCPATNKFTTRTYSDGVTLDQKHRGIGVAVYPSKDDQGNLLETEFGLCKFRDQQRILVQEMPENAPAGQLPRSIEIVAEDDLVDLCKPGDRVHLVGVYRAVPGASQRAGGSGVFRSIVVANRISQINQDSSHPQLTESDLYVIHQVASGQGHFDMLARSIAPSIFGHTQALLLQLLGGTEKNLENGTHLRGDINILLVGDPSTAKSQLLRFIMNIAPLSISTTGRGSSGVGLTAAVTHDQDTGERHLEAGAMVLADRGIVCIDEFDKMSEMDRVAIHEVMEQQTVRDYSKSRNTRIVERSLLVLAAANPQYGSYNKHKKPQDNIALPDSLLSRFDLLFIVLDNISAQQDREKADHVLRMHQIQSKGHVLNENEADDQSSVFTHSFGDDESSKDIIFSVSFLKKFIYYAKTRIKPILTEAAAGYISQVDIGLSCISYSYRELRQKTSERTLPITADKTLIRLATAHAKCRLSHEVTIEDAQLAEEILFYSLYNEAKTLKMKQVKRKRQTNTSHDAAMLRSDRREMTTASGEEDIYYFDETEEDIQAERARSAIRRSMRTSDLRAAAEDNNTVMDTDDQGAESRQEQERMDQAEDKENLFVSTEESINVVKEAIDSITKRKMSEHCTLTELMDLLEKQGMEQNEVERCLHILQGSGLIMYHDQISFEYKFHCSSLFVQEKSLC
eukprot:jgi/Galph1/5901/GphlegSOOS_G4599.1